MLALLAVIACTGPQQPDAYETMMQQTHQNEILAFQGGESEARSMVGKEYAVPRGAIEAICSEPRPNRGKCDIYSTGERFRVDAVATNDDGIFLRVLPRRGNPGYVDYKPGRLSSYQGAEADALDLDRRYAEIHERCKRPTRIGMRAVQVVNSCWGSPDHINRTETLGHVREQWVYPALGYLYLDDGVVVAMQTRQ
jgi:hypothetical protein